MIKKKTRETLFNLVLDTDMTVEDLAKLVEINGVQHLSKWGDWKAALPDNPNGQEAIKAAQDELSTFGTAFATNDTAYMHHYYECKENGEFHPLHAFGFNLTGSGELLLGEQPLMSLADKMEDLEAQLSNTQEEIAQLSNQIESLSKAAEAAKLQAEELVATSPIHELRAIAIHIWLQSNPPSTRVDFWDKMHAIDPKLFKKAHSKGATKQSMNRVNSAYQKRYNKRIEYPDGHN
jgi:hypothetical protein